MLTEIIVGVFSASLQGSLRWVAYFVFGLEAFLASVFIAVAIAAGKPGGAFILLVYIAFCWVSLQKNIKKKIPEYSAAPRDDDSEKCAKPEREASERTKAANDYLEGY